LKTKVRSVWAGWGARRWLDYYAILGVTPQASAEEIKSGYRKRSLSAHPDAGGSHAAFLLVNQAYEFLRDKNVRAAYDAARQPAATPMVIHHWQQAAQPAAKSAATVTEHFEHDLKGFDAWLDSLKKDFAAASYETKQEGRYNFPTVAGSKSGAAFIWLGRAIGAAVGIAVAAATVEEIRQGNWQDIRKVGYLPLYAGLFQWIGAGVAKFLHETIRDSVVAQRTEKVIHACVCGQKLRMPLIVGTLAVTCKRCKRCFGLEMSAAGIQEVCPVCKLNTTWDRVRCMKCAGSPAAAHAPVSVAAVVLGILFGESRLLGLQRALPWRYRSLRGGTHTKAGQRAYGSFWQFSFSGACLSACGCGQGDGRPKGG
jgi:hypothetical protein